MEKINEEELEQASGGKFKEGNSRLRIGSKFTTDFHNSYDIENGAYCKVTKVNYLDEIMGYEYNFDVYSNASNDRILASSKCSDYEITNGYTGMAGFKLIEY